MVQTGLDSSPEAAGMASNETKEPSRLLGYSLEEIEGYGKIIAFGAIALYVLGLVIVNVYLFQVGVSDFSVLRTRFVLTGALALSILIFIYSAYYSISKIMGDAKEVSSYLRHRKLPPKNVTIHISLDLAFFILVLIFVDFRGLSSNVRFRSYLFEGRYSIFFMIMIFTLFVSLSMLFSRTHESTRQ